MRGIIVVLMASSISLFILWWLGCKKAKTMSEQLERLRTEIAENASAIDSAVLLMAGTANQIRDLLTRLGGDADDAGGDSELAVAIGALADELDANSARLAAAVAQNTLADGDSDVVDGNGEVDESPPLGSEPSGDGVGTQANDPWVAPGSTPTPADTAADSEVLGGVSEDDSFRDPDSDKAA